MKGSSKFDICDEKKNQFNYVFLRIFCFFFVVFLLLLLFMEGYWWGVF